MQETYEDGSSISYRYDNSGNLATVTDSVTGTKTTYYYDLTDRMVKYTEKSGSNSFTVEYIYDAKNNLSARKENLNGTTRVFQYSYDDDNRVTAVTDGTSKQTYSYDGWGRLLGEGMLYNDASTLTKTYAYKSLSDTVTTGQIHSVTYDGAKFDRVYTYEYDKNGNIVSISDGTNTTTYEYDSANQLLRENNQAANKTWVWTYDSGGNILSRTEYVYTTDEVGTALDTVAYSYYTGTWRDKLIGFDGREIAYDNVGNPYRDGIWRYTWEHGRQLKTMTSMADSSLIWSYTYDANGMRTGRTNGTDTYTYVYNGGQLVSMKKNNDTLYFSYDASGVMSVTFNGTVYQYITNLQGDIMAIISPTTGEIVAEYTYDAWGNILSIGGSMEDTLALINPLRYRGYVYDQETGLYYLQSRYYNPNMGRFINADGYVATGQGTLGGNMFAYCLNNPVSYSDASGRFAITSALIGAAIGGAIGGAIIGAVSYVTSSGINGTEVTAEGLLGAIGIGALTGAIGGVAGCVSTGAKAVLSVGAGVIAGVYTGINTDGTTGEKIVAGITTGAIASASTFIGASIDTSGLSGPGAAFANFSTTLAVGVPAEMMAVGSQQTIDSIFDESNESSVSGNSIEPNPPKIKTNIPILSPYWRVN